MKFLLLIALILVTNATLTWSQLVDALESELSFRTNSQSQDSVEDEEELRAEKENSFFVRNNLKYAAVFATYGCDSTVVKKESQEISMKISGGDAVINGAGEITYKDEKEFETAFLTKTAATMVAPGGGFLAEAVSSSCDMVYATIYVKNSAGQSVPFMNTSGVHKGMVVEISGTPDRILMEKTWEACGGEECGCSNEKCWTKCLMGWCYTSDSEHTQSFKYKHCTGNSECTPELKCATSCTVGRL